MNKNILIVLGGGFLIALLVAIIVQASFGSRSDDAVEIAVAAKTLSTGAAVDDSNFDWKAWPKDSLLPGVVIREENKKIADLFKGGRLRRDLAVGEPLLQSAVTTAGKGNILATAMEPGMRAMAIKVSAESMVGGFISPNDRVDVVLTYQIRLSGDARDEAADKVDRYASQTVLENVRVLAIDQSSKKEDDKAKVGRTVTLEVDSVGAERLALARQMGELSLSLRSLGDEAVSSKARKTMTTDVEVSTVLQEIGKMKKMSGGKSDIVRVYGGDKVENVTVRR